MKLIQNKKARNKGFSLIEIIIAISIVGIMTTIALPGFRKATSFAKHSALKGIAQTLQFSLETYILNNGDYPPGEAVDLATLSEILIQSGDLTKIPVNPYTKKTYTALDTNGKIIYGYDNNSQTYSILAFGEDLETPIIEIDSI